MRLFTRNRITDETMTGQWTPDDRGILTITAEDMAGECAGGEVRGVRFLLPAAPGASVTVWAFAADCGRSSPGDYFVAYRADWMTCDSGGDATWSDSAYCGDLSYSEWWPDLDGAVAAARESAGILLRDGAGAALLQVPDSTIAGWFDWDGQPW